jgi:hypothetical protein
MPSHECDIYSSSTAPSAKPASTVDSSQSDVASDAFASLPVDRVTPTQPTTEHLPTLPLKPPEPEPPSTSITPRSGEAFEEFPSCQAELVVVAQRATSENSRRGDTYPDSHSQSSSPDDLPCSPASTPLVKLAQSATDPPRLDEPSDVHPAPQLHPSPDSSRKDKSRLGMQASKEQSSVPAEQVQFEQPPSDITLRKDRPASDAHSLSSSPDKLAVPPTEPSNPMEPRSDSPRRHEASNVTESPSGRAQPPALPYEPVQPKESTTDSFRNVSGVSSDAPSELPISLPQEAPALATETTMIHWWSIFWRCVFFLSCFVGSAGLLALAPLVMRHERVEWQRSLFGLCWSVVGWITYDNVLSAAGSILSRGIALVFKYTFSLIESTFEGFHRIFAGIAGYCASIAEYAETKATELSFSAVDEVVGASADVWFPFEDEPHIIIAGAVGFGYLHYLGFQKLEGDATGERILILVTWNLVALFGTIVAPLSLDKNSCVRWLFSMYANGVIEMYDYDTYYSKAGPWFQLLVLANAYGWVVRWSALLPVMARKLIALSGFLSGLFCLWSLGKDYVRYVTSTFLWVTGTAPGGRPFWGNRVTGHVRLVSPFGSGFGATRTTNEGLPDQRPATGTQGIFGEWLWAVRTAQDGRPFMYNQRTQEVHWVPPFWPCFEATLTTNSNDAEQRSATSDQDGAGEYSETARMRRLFQRMTVEIAAEIRRQAQGGRHAPEVRRGAEDRHGHVPDVHVPEFDQADRRALQGRYAQASTLPSQIRGTSNRHPVHRRPAHGAPFYENPERNSTNDRIAADGLDDNSLRSFDSLSSTMSPSMRHTIH